MPPGGARLRSGPAPDPNALRRDRPSDAKEWTVLPVRRDGPEPEWPLPDARDRERTIWARLWTMPQSVMWEQQQRELEVAIHVRTFAEAERKDASATLRNTLVRQMDNLGLTQTGLNGARWRIDDPQQAPVRTDDPNRESAKARFQRLQGGKSA